MQLIFFQFLLAEYALGKSAAYYLRTSNGWKELGMFMVGIMCVASFWMMLVYWEKLIKGIAPHEPEQDKMFQELCNNHHLTRGESNYLKALIEALRLSEPAFVFINPYYLDIYAKQGDNEAMKLRTKLFS